MRSLAKTQVLVFIIVVLLLANIAMLIFFTGFSKPGKRPDGGRRNSNSISSVLENKVGFDKQQMEQMKNLRKVHWERMHGYFEEIRVAKRDFYLQLSQPDVADSMLQRRAALIGQKQAAIDLQAFKNFREVRALCTPAQLPRYDSLIPPAIERMWFPARGSNNSRKEDSTDRRH